MQLQQTLWLYPENETACGGGPNSAETDRVRLWRYS